MSSEAQACFTYIFMPVFVISLLSQFVYQPVISKMALLWHEKKISQFNKLILRQIALILLLSVAAIIGGYLLGIPVLSLIYGVDLTDYKKSLVILLIGGGALAIVNFLQMIITVARKQKLLNIGYLLAFLLFVFGLLSNFLKLFFLLFGLKFLLSFIYSPFYSSSNFNKSPINYFKLKNGMLK